MQVPCWFREVVQVPGWFRVVPEVPSWSFGRFRCGFWDGSGGSVVVVLSGVACGIGSGWFWRFWCRFWGGFPCVPEALV